VVAEHDDSAVEAADMGIPPLARRIGAPFQHGAWEMQRAGHDSIPCPSGLGADVHDQRACRGGGLRLAGLEPVDPPPRGLEEVVDRGYFANSTARLSRITVTFTWPGYSSSASISRAISCESSTAPSSSSAPGCTITRISRPACMA